uniref:Vacuolar protein sorting-associated protein 13 VPS13 adaptor binding domain-containing protein n=1 Tax=Vitis vinifera TaxID=29760 RepID=F6I7D8_VITVI
MEGYLKTINGLSAKNLDEVPEDGIWISVHQTCFVISCEEGKLEVHTDLSRIQSVVFRSQSPIETSIDQSELRNLLQQSLDCLYEISLSNLAFTFSLASLENVPSSGSVTNALDGFTSGDISPSTIATETSNLHSLGLNQALGFASINLEPASSHWLLINISVSEIFLVRSTVKNVLAGAHQMNKLLSSLSVGGEFQTISWAVQGGFVFLETTAVVKIFHCFASYACCITDLLSVMSSSLKHIEKTEHSPNMARLDDLSIEEHVQETLSTSQQVRWALFEAFTMGISQISIVLVAEDESGKFRELVLEADIRLDLELVNMRKKFMLDLSSLSILSQILCGSVKNEIQIPHFASGISNDLLSHSLPGDPTIAFQRKDGTHPVPDGASSSSDPVSKKEALMHNSVSEGFQLSCQRYILKRLRAFILVQKSMPETENVPLHLYPVWVGNGSVSGFDMIISLSEIQMILSAVASFSEISTKETIDNLKQEHQSSSQGFDHSLEGTVPNAIVAIQDIHQHMYFTVEGVENKYSLVGALHYSLVGERALFRVKYHKHRRWNLPVSWFSLISLHAKSDSGEPLRLNCRPGSGFVDISSTNDSEWALWRTVSYKPESYEGDADWEPYSQLTKNTFYLINKKNDCAVAFVDGIPEFVRKPGNPFKLKVFHDSSLACDVAREPSCRLKMSLALMVMSTLSVMLYYFEVQRHLWRELVHPVEICIFYRSSFQIEGSEIVSQSVPMHFYFRCKEVEISLTEVSLDILLFVIGKLNLAGPFSVKTSMILAHCCKVENQSGLNLLFRYQDDQGLSIARKQSASIFLRHLASADQSPENASFASIQLSWFGSFSTSPIHLSLSKTQVLAWRTRIVSLQDSKTYPGPFIVVDISRKSEDGLSVVVSPLIRIHNETTFSMALRFQRPQQVETEFASVLLKTGDTIDDSMAAFDSINVSGGLKKALLSLSVGNFLFSFRPEITDDLGSSKRSLSVSWSDDFKGGKAVRLTGIFDKLNYKVRKAFSVEHVKCSFSTAHCSLKAEGAHIGNMHFLIQSIGRNVPVMLPDKSGDPSENRNSPVALQEQKEIFLLPTVRVSNLLQSEIHVLLTETDQYTSIGSDNIGNQATILCGSTVDLYANPTIIYFTVTITAFRSSCKPVNSTDWVKKLNKQKNDVYHLDIDLNFGGGKYFACLRLSRGLRGVLEAAIFTSYVLKNDTDFALFLSAPNQKSLSRDEAQKFGSSIPPEIGLFLPPKSTGSWFLKSNKVRFKLLEGKASESLLDLDALSGLTEISFETEQVSGFKHVTKLGVSLGPSLSKVAVPSQIVSLVPRYVVVNESEEVIIVRQCHLEYDMEHMIHINSGQKTPLQLHMGSSKKREYSLFDNFIRKHRNANDDSLIIVQFQLKDTGLGWSGPVCIASLGRFFLKFKQSLDVSILHSNHLTPQDKTLREFAIVHIVEEGSTLVLHFQKPPKINLPYRIENCLHEVSITYYQKDSEEPETIGSGSSVDYVWDDSTLPHKLVVKIDDIHELREINLDKVRAWKPFFKSWQHRRFPFHLPLDNRPSDQRRTNFGGLNGIEMIKVGYEVYADGTTRVLRICEFPDNHKGDKEFQSCAKIQLRVPCFAVHLLEHGKQDVDASEPSDYTTVIVVKLEHINMDSIFTNQHKFNQIRVQALNVEQKWVGAPFAALLRRHQSEYCEINDSILRVVFVLISTNSNVTQVKNSSIILQPVDLNLDEETLMRIVPFWRTSLSDSKSQSRQFYFDRFEIHPIKIIASFLPGDSYSSYSSAQETVRSLLHSVIKIPAIKNMVVELNGVLITHALITMRELFIKCAQHYSWYAMRAIYIAKGSPLLPPSFASIFDDSASSSLDVFFDPSSGLINLPGLTLGTFKLISKCIDGKGFSGTKRYFGDLGKTLRTAGSNVLFAVVTEISDSVLKGAETSGFNGMVSGFHQGILRLAMEPSLLGTAFVEGGPDRKIKLDRSPGVDELYIEGYLQAMLDTVYKQEYLRVRVIDNQVFLKNLPPNSSLIEEIMDRVKGFLISKALLKGDSSTTSRPLRHLRGESEWKIGPTVLTLCEHLFVSFAIRMLRKQAGKLIGSITWKEKSDDGNQKAIVPIYQSDGENQKAIVPASHSAEGLKVKFMWRWGIGKFVLSGIVAYIDGRLCRSIPNPLARRIVSGFLLSFLETDDH